MSQLPCGEDLMNKIVVVETGGQWVVMVESGAHHQEYICESPEQAHRWVTLLGTPTRQKDHSRERREG